MILKMNLEVLVFLTIVIALRDVENKRIIMGADNQATMGQLCYKGGKKLFSLDIPIVDGYGDILKFEKLHIGFSGNYWLINYLMYGFDVPLMGNNVDFVHYLYNDFFVSLGDALSSRMLLPIYDSELDSESEMLMVFEGKIYHIFSNFSVMEVVEEFGVGGSGSEVAVGSLSTNLMFGVDDRLEMVRQAVLVCGRNTIYCDDDVELSIIDL